MTDLELLGHTLIVADQVLSKSKLNDCVSVAWIQSHGDVTSFAFWLHVLEVV